MLIVVMVGIVPQGSAYIQTHQVVCIRSVRLFVYQLYLNKAIYKKGINKPYLLTVWRGSKGLVASPQHIYFGSFLCVWIIDSITVL